MDLAPPPVSDEQLQRADADDRAPRPVDQMLHAAVGRLTGGLSLASLSAAYADWFAHLLGSPGKQQQLLEKAWRESVRLGLWGRWPSRGRISGARRSSQPVRADVVGVPTRC